MIKPIWFGLNWGIRQDLILIDSNLELLDFVVNPTLCQGIPGNTRLLKAQTSIQLVLTLEFI